MEAWSEGYDTWEPIHHLPRRQLVKYYYKRQLSYPHNINDTFALKIQNGKVIRTSSYTKPVPPDDPEVQSDDDDSEVEDNNDEHVDHDDKNEARDETIEEDEEFVIDKIITHRVNKNKDHK